MVQSDGTSAKCFKGTDYQTKRMYVGAQTSLQTQLIHSFNAQQFHTIRSSNKGTAKQKWKPVTSEMHGFLWSSNPHYGMPTLPRRGFSHRWHLCRSLWPIIYLRCYFLSWKGVNKLWIAGYLAESKLQEITRLNYINVNYCNLVNSLHET